MYFSCLNQNFVQWRSVVQFLGCQTVWEPQLRSKYQSRTHPADPPPRRLSSARWSRSSGPRRRRPAPGCCPCSSRHIRVTTQTCAGTQSETRHHGARCFHVLLVHGAFPVLIREIGKSKLWGWWKWDALDAWMHQLQTDPERSECWRETGGKLVFSRPSVDLHHCVLMDEALQKPQDWSLLWSLCYWTEVFPTFRSDASRSTASSVKWHVCIYLTQSVWSIFNLRYKKWPAPLQNYDEI